MKTILELEKEYKYLKHQIKSEKQHLHKKFVINNRTSFLILDWMVVVMILFNFGAIGTTNFMVVKKMAEAKQELILYEVNPVIAEINDMEEHPQSRQFLSAYFKQALFWLFLIINYIYWRSTVFTPTGLFILSCVIGVYFMLYGLDFANDIGYFVGKKVFNI
jgi:hypothetical protein